MTRASTRHPPAAAVWILGSSPRMTESGVGWPSQIARHSLIKSVPPASAFPTRSSTPQWLRPSPQFSVMLGLDPSIHEAPTSAAAWILGSSPRMTESGGGSSPNSSRHRRPIQRHTLLIAKLTG
ncbi:hypothetical protein RHEC894_PD00098 (plasmid) [Rhizobium sp. CIAT894]|nr:hypothetical protein RHEC894_PD00098 [Rhizobium sp. CIAT894]